MIRVEEGNCLGLFSKSVILCFFYRKQSLFDLPPLKSEELLTHLGILLTNHGKFEGWQK